MSMSLTQQDMRDIADMLEKIMEAGIEVEQVKVGRHKVMIRWASDTQHGLRPTVIGMTTTDFANRPPPAGVR